MVVVIVDNDPGESAGPVIEWARQHTGLAIRAATEPRPGVSHARNRSVALAADADYIAVIDDDMTADPTWLADLLAARERFDADVVGGRVERWVADGGRAWAVDLELFAPITSGTDGDRAHAIELGNSIMRTAVLDEHPFDPSLGAIGGEDTHLFLRLTRDGRRIVTTETAIAREVIAAERTRLGWMFRRVLRLGSCWSVIERSVLGVPRRRRLARAAARIVRGLFTAVAGAVTFTRIRFLDGLLDAAEGVGMVLGAAGYTVSEYGRGGPRFTRVVIPSVPAERDPTGPGSGPAGETPASGPQR